MLVPPITARLLDEPPIFPGAPAPTAVQLAGLRYEARVVKLLQALHPRVEAGPWIGYKSRGQSGICQPDAVVWLDDRRVYVVEVKLSWQRHVRSKLKGLYGPLVRQIWGPDIDLSYLQVYKNWRRGCHKKPLNLYELESTFKTGKYKECHLP